MSRRVRGVLFDLDDTLYSREAWFRAWAHWFATERLALAAEAIAEHVAFLEQLDAHGASPRLGMFRELKARYSALLADERTLLQAFYDDQVHRVELDPEAGQLIAALETARVPFGVVSNGSDNQLRKLERLGLAERARCVLVSELVGLRKPDPAIFLAAADQLGVPAADVLFVGDNPENDVSGAAAVGMRTAWLRRGLPWPETLGDLRPDFTVTGLAELLWLTEG
ncbi:MAG: HAD family hydrolase [Chloroflexi bacterium]|nr:HAD family hydrolase [Chloroflexota bacterium]